MFEFPADDVAPLIQSQGEISVTSDPLGVRRIHDCFRSWSNSDRLSELRLTCLGHPSDFRRKALDMVLFSVQRAS